MKLYKSKVLKTAKKENGYLEKATNNPIFLNSKTANAGSNNFTKYGRDYGWNGVAWCCIFVWWCFEKTYGAKWEKLIKKTASCEEMRMYFREKSRYSTIPKKGALIFFWTTSQSRADHIGIVYKVTNNMVYTIEGNTSSGTSVIPNGGGVCKKSYARDNTRILGYGYPNYDEKSLRAPKAPLIFGAKSNKVKNLQKCLNRVLPVSLVEDGEYGEKTASAVKSFKMTFKMKSKNGKIYGKKMNKLLQKQMETNKNI